MRRDMPVNAEMPHAPKPGHPLPRLGDFTTDGRVLMLIGMAVIVGTGGAVAAWALLQAIALVTNLVWFQSFATHAVSLARVKPGPWVVLAPAAGGLAIGLMARFGSEKIRGHGIPEAIEAILIGGSRMQPKVALLKPLSSAISIGTGGPFGAEGPIIMTGGAIGSLFAQFFSLSAAERKTLLVAGAAAEQHRTPGHGDRSSRDDGDQAARLPFEEQKLDRQQHGGDRRAEDRRHAGSGAGDE